MDEEGEDGAPAEALTVASLLTPGYVDVPGSFFHCADGSREAIEYDGQAAGLQMDVPYDALQPFVVDARTGLGLRCTRPIKRGERIVEFVGEVLDDIEVRARYDEAVPPCSAHYLMSLGDNAVLQAKLRRGDTGLGDSELFVDQQRCGNKARYANDDEATPNAQVCYWPPPPRPGEELQPGRMLPRRAYLRAVRDVPALTELTYSYGGHYDRRAQQRDSGARGAPVRTAAAHPWRALPTLTQLASALTARRWPSPQVLEAQGRGAHGRAARAAARGARGRPRGRGGAAGPRGAPAALRARGRAERRAPRPVGEHHRGRGDGRGAARAARGAHAAAERGGMGRAARLPRGAPGERAARPRAPARTQLCLR